MYFAGARLSASGIDVWPSVVRLRFTFNVAARNPTFANPGTKSNREEDEISWSLGATDPASYALTYTITGLPPLTSCASEQIGILQEVNCRS